MPVECSQFPPKHAHTHIVYGTYSWTRLEWNKQNKSTSNEITETSLIDRYSTMDYGVQNALDCYVTNWLIGFRVQFFRLNQLSLISINFEYTLNDWKI